MCQKLIAHHLNETVAAQARATHFHRHKDPLNAIAALGLALSQLTQAVNLLAAAPPASKALPDAPDAPDSHATTEPQKGPSPC